MVEKRVPYRIQASSSNNSSSSSNNNNNNSERALRRLAEYCRILYGSRSSEEDAHGTKIIMSVYATCKTRNGNVYEFLKDYLSGHADRSRQVQKAWQNAVV